jgi:hypothetical protein
MNKVIEIDKGYLEIASELMKAILYDNGYVDRWHSEKSQFSKGWQNRIAPIAGKFFDLHPELLTDEVIENICCGFVEENKEAYGSLEGYAELDKILNEYFNSGCGVTSKFEIKKIVDK